MIWRIVQGEPKVDALQAAHRLKTTVRTEQFALEWSRYQGLIDPVHRWAFLTRPKSLRTALVTSPAAATAALVTAPAAATAALVTAPAATTLVAATAAGFHHPGFRPGRRRLVATAAALVSTPAATAATALTTSQKNDLVGYNVPCSAFNAFAVVLSHLEATLDVGLTALGQMLTTEFRLLAPYGAMPLVHS